MFYMGVTLDLTIAHSGKEILIKAVASATPAYPMTCFKLPSTLRYEIAMIMANFWASWAWNSLLVGCEILIKGARWQVMNGNTINIWSDTWLPQHDPGYLRASCPSSYLGPLSNQSVYFFAGCPSNHGNSYLLMNERCSVKFRYYYLMKHKKNQVVMKACSSHVIDSNVWFRIWNCQTLPKIKIFLWRSVNGFLPTFEILFKRKLCQSPICPFCKEQPESIEHTLFLCPWAAKVWFASCIAYRPLPQAFTSLDSWILDLWLCETFNLPLLAGLFGKLVVQWCMTI
ncbi:unnamed protein product [Prunus brigantina]